MADLPLQEPADRSTLQTRLWFGILVLLFGIALTVVFWGPLYRGGGFIGGDVYSYYLPQKSLLADELNAGRFPLWNPRTGLGYPLIGESQTGIFYPLHLLGYRYLDVATAYSAVHLAHYLLCFVFVFLWLSSLGMSRTGSLLGSIVFVYSWFPSRNCWEWAIVTGSWLPGILWRCELWLQRRTVSRFMLLGLFVALQLLAGHFNLAFVTLLFTVFYGLARTCCLPGLPTSAESNSGRKRDPARTSTMARIRIGIVLALVLGLGIAAPQLLPTWKLKQQSQRQQAGAEHRLEFGQIPPRSWSQLTGWIWQSESGFSRWHHPAVPRDQLLRDWGAHTNQVESHLYVGLLPLGCLLILLLTGVRRRQIAWLFWPLVAVAATVYSSGWFVDVLGRLPGFSFFQGPGRFTILVSLSAAVATGICWQHCHRVVGRRFLDGIMLMSLTGSILLILDVITLYEKNRTLHPFQSGFGPLQSFFWTGILSGFWILYVLLMLLGTQRASSQSARRSGLRLVLWVTCLIVDFWSVSRLITYSPMVDRAPIGYREDSPLRRILGNHRPRFRCLAPGGNLLGILDVSSLPVYLTFGPEVYVKELAWLKDIVPEKLSETQRDKLIGTGCTHLLSLKEIPTTDLGLKLIWKGSDPVLGRALNHSSRAMFLYEFSDASGRVEWKPDRTGNPAVNPEIEWLDDHPNEISLHVVTREPGTLVLHDLADADWHGELDGQPMKPLAQNRMSRAVHIGSGEHQIHWKYSPAALYWGFLISIICLLGLVMAGRKLSQ